MNKSFNTLEKVMDVLSMFDLEHQEMSAQEIAQGVAMPLSTTYRYLQAFLKRGILSRDEATGRFSLGLAVARLGLLACEKISVIGVCHPYLKPLAESSCETAALTVLDGLGLVYVDVVEGPRSVKFSVGRGSALPLYAGSPGKAVLAFKDQAFIDKVIQTTRLAKLGKNTITEPERLRAELAGIRRLGFSESDSEFDLGVASIAAPIFDHRGEVIASLSVAGPTDRVIQSKPKLIDLVLDAARSISTQLGYGKNWKSRSMGTS
ncbi:MAG: IclR family transcriptional regulator [Syntrophobacteraceae bacterium]|nr:IclR family transcriptional regulator [Syntrophobacteraceae bacterium]